MKYLIVLLSVAVLSSCAKKPTSSGSPVAKTPSGPVVEDVLNRLYNALRDDEKNLIKKLEFYDNDTVKVTKGDDSYEVLKQENVDEGEEDDTDLLLETLCEGTASGTTTFVDTRLSKISDNSFVSNLGAEVWEGTCNGQAVSCAAMLVYDVDPVSDEASPIQGYMFGLNNDNGCEPIKDAVEELINQQFEK